MTLAQAARLIGRVVVYNPPVGDRETGVISSVSGKYVFVCYGIDRTPRATDPERLVLAGAP